MVTGESELGNIDIYVNICNDRFSKIHADIYNIVKNYKIESQYLLLNNLVIVDPSKIACKVPATGNVNTTIISIVFNTDANGYIKMLSELANIFTYENDVLLVFVEHGGNNPDRYFTKDYLYSRYNRNDISPIVKRDGIYTYSYSRVDEIELRKFNDKQDEFIVYVLENGDYVNNVLINNVQNMLLKYAYHYTIQTPKIKKGLMLTTSNGAKFEPVDEYTFSFDYYYHDRLAFNHIYKGIRCLLDNNALILGITIKSDGEKVHTYSGMVDLSEDDNIVEVAKDVHDEVNAVAEVANNGLNISITNKDSTIEAAYAYGDDVKGLGNVELLYQNIDKNLEPNNNIEEALLAVLLDRFLTINKNNPNDNRYIDIIALLKESLSLLKDNN